MLPSHTVDWTINRREAQCQEGSYPHPGGTPLAIRRFVSAKLGNWDIVDAEVTASRCESNEWWRSKRPRARSFVLRIIHRSRVPILALRSPRPCFYTASSSRPRNPRCLWAAPISASANGSRDRAAPDRRLPRGHRRTDKGGVNGLIRPMRASSARRRWLGSLSPDSIEKPTSGIAASILPGYPSRKCAPTGSSKASSTGRGYIRVRLKSLRLSRGYRRRTPIPFSSMRRRASARARC